MKYLLLLWGLTGPHIEGVFFDRAMCEAVADHPLTTERAASALCVPMEHDKLVSDVVLYDNRLKEGEIREYQRSPNRP